MLNIYIPDEVTHDTERVMHGPLRLLNYHLGAAAQEDGHRLQSRVASQISIMNKITQVGKEISSRLKLLYLPIFSLTSSLESIVQYRLAILIKHFLNQDDGSKYRNDTKCKYFPLGTILKQGLEYLFMLVNPALEFLHSSITNILSYKYKEAK